MDAYLKSMKASMPKIKHKRKVASKVVSPLERPDWNNRFFVESIGNYSRKHHHFKQYFDSPHNKEKNEDKH